MLLLTIHRFWASKLQLEIVRILYKNCEKHKKDDFRIVSKKRRYGLYIAINFSNLRRYSKWNEWLPETSNNEFGGVDVLRAKGVKQSHSVVSNGYCMSSILGHDGKLELGSLEHGTTTFTRSFWPWSKFKTRN